MINQYQSKKSKITSIQSMTTDMRLITLVPGDNFSPGQFYILNIPGFGETSLSPASTPSKTKLQFLIPKQSDNNLLQKMFSLKKGDDIYLRGPYGKGFNFELLKNKNVAFIAQEHGLSSIKCLIDSCYKQHVQYRQLQLFYELDSQMDINFQKYLDTRKKHIEILITSTHPDKSFTGNTGSLSDLINKNTILKNSIIILSGPSNMYKKISQKLLLLGISKDDIYLQLDHEIHCGVGSCNYCTYQTKRPCQDGPILKLSEI